MEDRIKSGPRRGLQRRYLNGLALVHPAGGVKNSAGHKNTGLAYVDE